MGNTVRAATAVLSRDRRKAVAALLVFWGALGVATTLQRDLALHLSGADLRLSQSVRRGLAAGLPWVPLTLLIVGLHRRFPLAQIGRRRSLAVHLASCLAIPLLYNLLFGLAWRPGSGMTVIATAALGGWLEHLHLSVAAYWVILGAESWRCRIVRAREPLETLTVRSGQAVDIVRVESIEWIEGAGDYVRLHTDRGSFLSSATLKELSARLSSRGFLRVHRSAIVNLDRVRSYRPLGHGDYRLTLGDGTKVKVSRTRGREFVRRMTR